MRSRQHACPKSLIQPEGTTSVDPKTTPHVVALDTSVGEWVILRRQVQAADFLLLHIILRKMVHEIC